MELVAKLKTAPLPMCHYAAVVGYSPSQLSLIVRGRTRVRYLDERCVRIGAMLGLKPAECFNPLTEQVIDAGVSGEQSREAA